MAHRLVEVTAVDRAELPHDIAMSLPVALPSIVDPGRRHYAYQWLCACGHAGDYVASTELAIESWTEHVTGDEVRTEQDRRDEIVRLVDELGGLQWIRDLHRVQQMVMPPDVQGADVCPDCGRPVDDGHEAECTYHQKML